MRPGYGRHMRDTSSISVVSSEACVEKLVFHDPTKTVRYIMLIRGYERACKQQGTLQVVLMNSKAYRRGTHITAFYFHNVIKGYGYACHGQCIHAPQL